MGASKQEQLIEDFAQVLVADAKGRRGDRDEEPEEDELEESIHNRNS